MPEKEFIHIRISKDMLENTDNLIDKGLFSNKNEIMRAAIRIILLKYKDEIKTKK